MFCNQIWSDSRAKKKEFNLISIGGLRGGPAQRSPPIPTTTTSNDNNNNSGNSSNDRQQNFEAEKRAYELRFEEQEKAEAREKLEAELAANKLKFAQNKPQGMSIISS